MREKAYSNRNISYHYSMFSSIFNNFESFVEMWQKPDDSDIQHNFSEGVRVHNLPAAEPGPTCPLRTEPQLGVGLVNERDVMLDHHQRLTDGDLVHSLQMEIQRMQRREQSVLTAMELMRQELTEKDQLLQLLTNQLKSTNLVETEQKQCQHSEYEEKLRMCHDTIHRLEEKLQSADRAVELLERKLKERKESMEQMATREHNYQLALESLQKQFAEKEDQLQSVKNELNHLESQRIGSQKLISENKDLQKRLKAKHGQLKQLCQQFLQYQKERISVISQALATHYEHKRHDQKADT